jgi:hypothetical protein
MKRAVFLGACLALACSSLQAGVINPDCDAGKAAKSAAMKATVGVGGRCSAKEAVTDSVGIDDHKGKDAVKDGKEKVSDGLDKPSNKLIKKAMD